MTLEHVRLVEYVIAWIGILVFLIWYLPRGWFRSLVGVVTATFFIMLFSLLSLGLVRLGFNLAGYEDYDGRQLISTVLLGLFDLALIGATVAGVRAYSMGRAAARRGDGRKLP